MRERDQRDRTRAEAPLTQAPDADYLDSTGFRLDEVEEAILKLVRARIVERKGISQLNESAGDEVRRHQRGLRRAHARGGADLAPSSSRSGRW